MNLYDQLGLNGILGSGNSYLYQQLAQSQENYNNYAATVCAKAADPSALPDKRLLLLEDCE